MRRREFIGGLSGAAVWPFIAGAQQAMPVIGFLAPMSPDNVRVQTAAFHQGLNEAGYQEGANVSVVYRWGEDRISRLPELATDLIRRQVNVIAAFSTASIRAAKAATSTVPIVFMTGDDPVAAGAVTSLNRPDANVTGVTFSSSVVGAKRFELLLALAPKRDLVAILNDANSSESQVQSRDARQVARKLGLSILDLDIRAVGDIDRAFATMAERKVSAFFASGSPFLNAHRGRLSDLAIRHSLPGVYANRNFVAAGGLISYGANVSDAYRQSGAYVGRILKGASPADLPVLQPTKFEMVINLKTAKAMGLAVPDRLLALADEVIE